MTVLPTPGGDDGTWGTILNDFLLASFNTDGSLNSEAVGTALGPATVRIVSGTVALGEYTIFGESIAGQTMTLPTPPGACTNIIKNLASVPVTVGPQIYQGFFGYISLNPGDSVALTFFPSSGLWYPIFPQTEVSEPVLNVVDWGADPTGSADSTGAIQAAINAGNNSVVYFPQGTYKISQTLEVGNGTLLRTTTTAGFSAGAVSVTSTSGFPAATVGSPKHLCFWIANNGTPIVATYTGTTPTSFTGLTHVSGSPLTSITASQFVTAGTVSTVNNVVLRGPALNTHSWFGALGFASQAATILWAGSTGTGQMVQFNGPITGGGIQNLFFDCAAKANGAYYTLGLQSGVFENVWVQSYYANGYYYSGVSAFYDEVRGDVVAGDSMFCMTRNCGGLTTVTGQNTNLYFFDGDTQAFSSQSPNATYSYVENPIWTGNDPGSGFTCAGLYFRGCDNIKVYGGDFIASVTGNAGTVAAVVFDFTELAGTAPQSCLVDGLNPGSGPNGVSAAWVVRGTHGAGSDPNIVTNIRGGATEPASIIATAGVQWLSDTVNGNYTIAPGAWTAYIPTWHGTVTNPVPGNANVIGFYQKTGRTVNFSIFIQAGSTTSFGAGGYTFGLPFESANTAGGAAVTGIFNDATFDWVASGDIPGSSIEFSVLTNKGGTSGSLQTFGPTQFTTTPQYIKFTGVYQSLT